MHSIHQIMNSIETKDFETIINNINSYEVKYDNLHLYKVLYIFTLLFKSLKNKILFFLYILSEIVNTATSYINIIIFSSILTGGGNISITSQIVYLYIINNLVNSWSSQCSSSLIKYISFTTAIDFEQLMAQKLDYLDIYIIDKIQKIKLLQYINHFIPDFIESLPIYSHLFFLLIVLFLGNVYLGYNAFFNQMIVLNVGFVAIVSIVLVKYISVMPFLNHLTELFQNKFQINDEMYSNLEYLKSSNILLKEYQNDRIIDSNRTIIQNNTKFIMLSTVWEFIQSMIMSAIVASIFSFKFDNIYLFLYCINNFLTPLESNIVGFLNSFYNISYICGLYDFFNLENRTKNDEKTIVIANLNDVFEQDLENDVRMEPFVIPHVSSIEFRNVSKKYIDKTVLEDVSFIIEKGKKLGIIGESGSGKTTIARLIMKLIYSSSGEIFMNRLRLNDLSVNMVRDHIVYIGQDPKLFNLSLKYNLTMEMNDEKKKFAITDEELLDCLVKMNLQGQEERLDQPIGISGSKFSGGQKQKINILRGLLKNASCIILDEPTSALDVNSEHQVMDYIYSMYGEDKMMIVIAHKLNTIKNVDHILVMDEGKVVEQGSHETLLALDNVYSGMVKKFYSL